MDLTGRPEQRRHGVTRLSQDRIIFDVQNTQHRIGNSLYNRRTRSPRF